MFEALKKLKYGARVLLSRSGGQPETIDLLGRPTVLMHAGEGPPFVYLHSTLGEAFQWLPFYQSWAREFRVLVPTHPGFGQSGGFDRVDTIEDMAFHYVELFDALGLGEINLGGVSLGGWIAAEFAVRWPERVRRLWIADAPGLWVEDQPLPDLFRIVQDRDAMRALLFHDPDGLHRIQCPTLLVWGEHDRLVPPAYGEAYRQHIKGAELKLIRDCGHLPMFEKEAEFVATVSAFCRG
jgi:pimeloyl-ACP methyl ester carboxylesterase